MSLHDEGIASEVWRRTSLSEMFKTKSLSRAV